MARLALFINMYIGCNNLETHKSILMTEKEGKAVHLGYAEKCALVGLTQQVTHGPFDPSSSPPIGVLDVVGKDRR